eukprot:5839405-Amphidinium_carterae.1
MLGIAMLSPARSFQPKSSAQQAAVMTRSPGYANTRTDAASCQLQTNADDLHMEGQTNPQAFRWMRRVTNETCQV